MKLSALLIAVVLFPAPAWAAFVGIASGGPPPAQVDLACEPWVKAAQIGDFTVTVTPGGTKTRKEVKAISDDFVSVEVTTSVSTSTWRYHRTGDMSASQALPEMGMKKTSSEKRKIGSSTAACETWDGETSLNKLSISAGGVTVEYEKTTRYQKVVSSDVPFGGIVKIARAPDDGVKMPGIEFGNKKAPPVSKHFENKNTNLEVLSEVIDFGHGQLAKK